MSDECSAAKGWTIKNKVLELNWGVIGGAQEVRPKYVIGAVSGTEFVWEASDIGDYLNHLISLTLLLIQYVTTTTALLTPLVTGANTSVPW